MAKIKGPSNVFLRYLPWILVIVAVPLIMIWYGVYNDVFIYAAFVSFFGGVLLQAYYTYRYSGTEETMM